jgi:hypothetical protein
MLKWSGLRTDPCGTTQHFLWYWNSSSVVVVVVVVMVVMVVVL